MNLKMHEHLSSHETETSPNPEPIKGRGRCPACACRKVGLTEQPITDFYSRTLEVCANCGAAWEPMPPGGEHLDSDGTPFPFNEPCDNCAFRPGSHEQQDTEEWKKTMGSLKKGGRFFCHKGVTINLENKSGFNYPTDGNGKPIIKKLRTCRGYLNMISRHWQKEFSLDLETTAK